MDSEQKIERYKMYKGREEPKVSALDESGKDHKRAKHILTRWKQRYFILMN